jgi:hypothetical protein
VPACSASVVRAGRELGGLDAIAQGIIKRAPIDEGAVVKLPNPLVPP